MAEITLELTALNPAALDAELRAALGEAFTGLAIEPGAVRALFTTEPTPEQAATVASVAAGHDADALTAGQQAALASAERAAGAVERVRAIPQWARLSEADALAWLDANLSAPVAAGEAALASATTLAAVKPVVAGMLALMRRQNETLEKLARLTLALRDAQWPGLADEA